MTDPGERRGPAETPAYPLVALVCGYEKSGTTLLNEILRRHPRLDSGFEGGFLLGESPRDFPRFQPYHTFFRQTWELTQEDVAYICACDDWGECYRRARERSPVITDKDCLLFDKTPIYMKFLSQVLARVPGVPCVVNVRDPRALMVSWANWSGGGDDAEAWVAEHLENNVQRFTDYAEGYRLAASRFPGRILLNRFEQLVRQPEATLERIFQFLGFSFSEDYLEFSSKHFVYGNAISADYLFPYRDRLSEKLCGRILEATRDYADWHDLAE